MATTTEAVSAESSGGFPPRRRRKEGGKTFQPRFETCEGTAIYLFLLRNGRPIYSSFQKIIRNVFTILFKLEHPTDMHFPRF